MDDSHYPPLRVHGGMCCYFGVRFFQVKREERDHQKALKSWADAANNKGFEFQDLGIQDLLIKGFCDGFEVRVHVDETQHERFFRDMPVLSTRVMIRPIDGRGAKNIAMESSLRGPPIDKNSNNARRLEDHFRNLNDAAMAPSEIVDPILRKSLFLQVEKNDSISINFGEVIVIRDELILEVTELTEMIDEALKTAQALNRLD